MLTELGIIIDSNDVQEENAPLPIVLTELGIITDFNDLQLKNTELPMVL